MAPAKDKISWGSVWGLFRVSRIGNFDDPGIISEAFPAVSDA